MKAQSNMLEQVILLLFIVIVLVAVAFFLTGWQVSQLELEKTKGLSQAALTAPKVLGTTQELVTRPYMFDDASLTSLKGNEQEFCKYMKEKVGREWFAEIQVIEDPPTVKECNSLTYPDCNYWSFCAREGKKISYTLPVNIQRKHSQVFRTGIIQRTDIAVMTAGIYTDTGVT